MLISNGILVNIRHHKATQYKTMKNIPIVYQYIQDSVDEIFVN